MKIGLSDSKACLTTRSASALVASRVSATGSVGGATSAINAAPAASSGSAEAPMQCGGYVPFVGSGDTASSSASPSLCQSPV